MQSAILGSSMLCWQPSRHDHCTHTPPAPASGCLKYAKTKAFQTAEAMLALVLPSGFPSSVRHPYKTYAGWQFTAMTASAASGVMSTQALVSYRCWRRYRCRRWLVSVLSFLLLSSLNDSIPSRSEQIRTSPTGIHGLINEPPADQVKRT